VGSIPHTGKKRKACGLLVKNTDGKKTTWKIRRILSDNIKMDLTEIDCEDMYYTVASFVVMPKNLSFHKTVKSHEPMNTYQHLEEYIMPGSKSTR